MCGLYATLCRRPVEASVVKLQRTIGARTRAGAALERIFQKCVLPRSNGRANMKNCFG